MKTTAIGILTFNRRHTLEKLLASLKYFNALDRCHVAVFEDCGYKDDTHSYLLSHAKTEGVYEPLFESMRYEADGFTIFLGKFNLGVSGNSNKAIKWFESLPKTVDHLMLSNDDFVFTGDADIAYRKAHLDTNIGMFCFNDFEEEQFKGKVIPYKGHNVRSYTQMTGMMISVMRAVVDTIGYYDARFVFGEEHCDYTNRARFCWYLCIDNVAHPCLDVNTATLASQKGHESTYTGLAKQEADMHASAVLNEIGKEYNTKSFYKPYRLHYNQHANSTLKGAGIPTINLDGYTLVESWYDTNTLNC
jgi:glycosyltransferase involved in cell wall biosynthesis